MLRYAGAPKKLVEFALVHATFLLNRFPRERKGQDLGIPLDRWLGFPAPKVLHVIKAYALDMGKRGKFDSKVTKTVHVGYDVARSADIICTLPHYKVTYYYKPDPQPFELCEERASVPIRLSGARTARRGPQ